MRHAIIGIVGLGAAAIVVAIVRPAPAAADSQRVSELAARLRQLDSRVFPVDGERAKELPQMLARDVRRRMQEANLRENALWEAVKTRADWERYRDARIAALRASLGQFTSAPDHVNLHVTRTLPGDGFHIDNLVYESRPGLLVTANLYCPEKPLQPAPGIIIAHSHHAPKSEGELQDMGMTWARAGSFVLVPDELGHGERRQHPFNSAADYPHPFRAGRQDYYFRYNSGVQLQLVGDSLMGWLAWDLMRGIDVLLAQPGIDRDNIIMLGSVAGGGDQAAVAAALDPRIKAVAPFNFGGPQPDYKTAENVARDFYWFGVADWESTRALRLGAREGFAQWLIVASFAPRPLIYGYEFAWDKEHDPVWPRLEKIYGWYSARDHLTAAYGRGSLKGHPPESSHANNIGPLQRSRTYPALEHWFGMPVPTEYSRRRPASDLKCLTAEAVEQLKPRSLSQLLPQLANERAAAMRDELRGLKPAEVREKLADRWEKLLGEVNPHADAKIVEHRQDALESVSVLRVALEVEPGIVVPLVLLMPAHKTDARLPLVIGLAQGGKQAFLTERADGIAELLAGGAAVCLVDVRGTGETRPSDGSRGRGSAATEISATYELLGQPLIGQRLRDLRSVLRYVRSRPDVDERQIALWGDSFAPANPSDANLKVPLDADPFPNQAEPLGGLLALLGALFDDHIAAIYIRGGLANYRSLLESPFLYLPHDAVVSGAMTAGDLSDLAAVLAPCPLRLDQMVDGLDQEVSPAVLERQFAAVRAQYRRMNAAAALDLGDAGPKHLSAAGWTLRQLLSR